VRVGLFGLTLCGVWIERMAPGSECLLCMVLEAPECRYSMPWSYVDHHHYHHVAHESHSITASAPALLRRRWRYVDLLLMDWYPFWRVHAGQCPPLRAVHRLCQCSSTLQLFVCLHECGSPTCVLSLCSSELMQSGIRLSGWPGVGPSSVVAAWSSSVVVDLLAFIKHAVRELVEQLVRRSGLNGVLLHQQQCK
jgi:hypothetical protein